MHRLVATLAVAISTLAIAAQAAQAAPTEVDVRIEGRSETLFEGPIRVEPHGIRAASDTVKGLRSCDGINPNDPLNVTPAVTPTAASADAMALIGETFDGQWYGQFEDYFLTRWGPDEQDPAGGAYWGLLVNDVFTSVGGCQYQLDGNDEILWVYDAFQGRPTLAMFPAAAGYDSGSRPLTATAALNEPFPVEVVSYADDQEDDPPATPSRLGSSGFAGAKVSPVITGAKGFEKVDAATGVTTDSEGKTSVTFTEPGWHRIKATVGEPGSESVVRSNRLDVCVPGGGGASLEGASGCGELPAADQVRVPPTAEGEAEAPHHEEAGATQTETERKGPSAAPVSPEPDSIHVTLPHLDRKDIAHGRLGVSWRILSPGPGVRGWTIASQTLGRKGARYVTRATGTRATSATVRLPAGASYRLRFTIADALGRSSTAALGRVTVPDARHR